MKAMVYHGNRDLRLETVQEPVPGPGEVNLRIDYCGICATDIEEYQFGPVFIIGDAMPVVIGHEMTGTVVETGEGVENVKSGDRVVINGMLSCGQCWWCRKGETTQCQSVSTVGFGADGGLAEQMVWRADQVIRLPDQVSSEAAALVEPASVAHHAVRRGRPEPGEHIAVLGAGTVGLLAMQAARVMGAHVYAVDRRRTSLDMARQLGAEATINPDETDSAQSLADLTEGRGPDVVIDAAGGKDTPRQSIEWVRKGGRVVLVAIYTSKPEFDFNSIVAGEVELIGSLGYQREDVEEAVRHIASGAIKTTPLISDVIGLDDVVDVGFARMMAPTKDFFRILVAPSKGPSA